MLAKNATTIDQMSGGRLDLGVGTGWMDHEHESFGIPFPDSSERWARFEDALSYLDEAFADGRSTYDGDFYSLDAEVKPKPTGLRIVLGGSGKKRTPTLAGRRADEYNFFTCPPEEAKAKVDVMREAAAGRDVGVTVMGPALVGKDESEYRSRLDVAAAIRGVTADDLEERWTKAGQLIGDSKRVNDQISALEDAGVERIYVQWIDLDDMDGMKRTFEVITG